MKKKTSDNMWKKQDQVGFIQEMQGSFNAQKSVNVIHYTNSLKKKSHMIISTDTFDNIINPFLT